MSITAAAEAAHCSNLCCPPRLYLQMQLLLLKHIVSISLQFWCWRADSFLLVILLCTMTCFQLFLPLPLCCPNPFLSPGLLWAPLSSLLCSPAAHSWGHLQRHFCCQEPTGCEALHQWTQRLPFPPSERPAKKWRRCSLVKKLLINSTDQWQLGKHFF